MFAGWTMHTLLRTAVIGYLGATGDHRLNFVRLLRAAGREPPCFDDSVTFRVARDGRRAAGLAGRLGRAADQWFGTWDAEYVEYLVAGIDAAQVDCLVGYWGTDPLGDLIAVKRRRPNLKVVLNVLCHPTGLAPGKVGIQNRLMHRAARFLDGLIFPSRAMQAYFARHVLGTRRVASVVLRPLLARSLHPNGPLPSPVPGPSLVFLGRMGASETTQPTDDVSGEIDRLLASAVHVYHHETKVPLPVHPYRHTFGYMALADVTTYSRQFDASLIVYNTSACRCDVRFRLVVPDRLIASVAAGVPVAIPRHGYEAAKEYLRDYRAVIEYDSPEELKSALADRDRVRALKLSADADRVNYVADDELDRLADFLGHVLRPPARLQGSRLAQARG